jgi:hypothetical protein
MEKQRELREREDRGTETKPYTRAYLARLACPFYGFIFDDRSNVMRDTGENQCAFASIINLPHGSYCLMEAVRDKQSWCKCSLNTPRNKLELLGCLGDIRVFPKEFPGGMSLGIWMRYIQDNS